MREIIQVLILLTSILFYIFLFASFSEGEPSIFSLLHHRVVQYLQEK